MHTAIDVELERLPTRHREVMALRLHEDLSYEEISERLSIPLGTVKSRIARARFCLEKSLGLSNGQTMQARYSGMVRPRS